MDGRAWNNIMELIGENQFPSLCQLLLLCQFQFFALNRMHSSQPFRFAVEQFHLPVHSLIISLAGVSSTMIFQIQLSVPGMYIAVCIFHSLFQITEELSRCGSLQRRKSRNLIDSASSLQQITVDSAASVSIAI